MRWLFGGLTLLLFSAASLFAQAKGEVESIGFNNTYRPDGWTPMVVRLRPDSPQPGNYLLQVRQFDLDGDRESFVRPITLNGSDQSREQRFWMYFIPQPINGGLADPTTGTLKDLQNQLQVFLCTPSGKQLAQLPITSIINNVDPVQGIGLASNPRGAKLVLAISGGGNLGSEEPLLHDYQGALGIQEDVQTVNLQPRDLPDNLLGYSAVDAIIWLNSDPAELDQGGERRLEVLRDYVRYGGRLVICQPAEWERTLGFGDLLPVDLQGESDRTDLEPLRTMAQSRDPIHDTFDPWAQLSGPFRVAKAAAHKGTLVDSWMKWPDHDPTPFIVHGAYGLGTVTWVAQDLADPALTRRASTGWPYVWDRIFGWHNDTFVPSLSAQPDEDDVHKSLYVSDNNELVDLGHSLGKQQLNFTGRAAALVFIAIIFFIVYWLAAGPGGFIYLKTRGQAELNWFYFAAAALVATVLTVVVVKLVVRGPPQLRHISLVRIAPDQPALVYSRLGLYIPRDGEQRLSFAEGGDSPADYIAGLAAHPQEMRDAAEFPVPLDYTVPIRDQASVDPIMVDVPYRSTSKELEARWTGQLPLHILGNPKLDPDNRKVYLSGQLTNATGIDLQDVYLALDPHNGGGDEAGMHGDRLIYLPVWRKDTILNLGKDLAAALLAGGGDSFHAAPGEGKVIADWVGDAAIKTDRSFYWIGYWYGPLRRSTALDSLDDAADGYPISFPMMSLFERIPPTWNLLDQPKSNLHGEHDRVDLLRRGGRIMDLSQSIAAGQLVILAHASGTLPMPLQVDGDRIDGQGTTFYQFVLPLDRGISGQVPSTQAAP